MKGTEVEKDACGGHCACSSAGRLSFADKGGEPHGAEEEDCGHHHSHGEGASRVFTAVRLGVSGALLAAGLILSGGFHLLSVIFCLAAFALAGCDVVWSALKNTVKGKMLDEHFLMSLASVGAIVLGMFAEAAAVMLFYQVGEFFQELSVRRSKASIASLMDIRPDTVRLRGADGTLVQTNPANAQPGGLAVVYPGERIALDGIITEGETALDMRALTGESVPRAVGVGDEVLSGSVVLDGMITVKITRPFAESAASRIVALAEKASEHKAPAEKFITRFSRRYTPAVVCAALLLMLVPPLFTGDWATWAGRALVFLVISCPCALVLSVPLGFFGGIGAAARKGVLVKGGNVLEAFNRMNVAVFDKTGTLTEGVFRVTGVYPAPGVTEARLLEAAAAAEGQSSHPVAQSVCRAFTGQIDAAFITEAGERAGRGAYAVYRGERFAAGSADYLTESGIALPPIDRVQGTAVYVAADGAYIGCITAADTVRPGSAPTVAALKAMGVRTVMLTGDAEASAAAVAAETGIAETHARLLPQDKTAAVEALMRRNKKGSLMFMGDGINDAPVLRLADVGVAMGGIGSDAAVEAADAVIMTDDPAKLLDVLKVARRTRRKVMQNIVFSLTVKGAFLLLGAFGLISIWAAEFADVGVALLTVFNSMLILREPKLKKR